MNNLFESLKNDLCDAFKYRNLLYDLTEESDPVRRVINTKEYFYRIDPENFSLLKDLFKEHGKGTDSLLSFAEKIRRGKFILPNT